MMKSSSLPESGDACILDMENFTNTIAGIKANRVRPDIVGSIIAHYASTWLPELSSGAEPLTDSGPPGESPLGSGGSVTALWMKKRFVVETLVGMLPPERGAVPCNFLLRLLRTANSAGAALACRAELEDRISGRLEEASLRELMIPSFCHTCGTVLDVELVLRMVRKFVSSDESGKSGAAALAQVGKLVDGYLAEAAVDSNLALPEFLALAGAVPGQARAADDGLYRAIDTYLKAHPSVPKHERKALCRLLDGRKLSPEASLHAAHNERLPVRAVIQLLFSKPHCLPLEYWSGGSFNRILWSPKGSAPPEPPFRSLSRREISTQQMEIKKLREDVARLQRQCGLMQAQVEKLSEKKKGFFRWRKCVGLAEKIEEGGAGEAAAAAGSGKPPADLKWRLVRGKNSPKQWRKSM